jgi:hypothetical protein
VLADGEDELDIPLRQRTKRIGGTLLRHGGHSGADKNGND